MEADQIRKIKEAKEAVKGLGQATLLEALSYIDEKIKIYETQHKV